MILEAVIGEGIAAGKPRASGDDPWSSGWYSGKLK